MKHFIIPILLIFFMACQKDAELAIPEEQDFLVYNQSLQCRPLESENGFFVITLTDSVPWLIHIEPSGKLNPLLNLSTYFPSDVVFDSITNLNASHLANENIMVAFTYNSTENDTVSMIQAIEIKQGGTLVGDLLQAIPTYNNNTYQYTAISKNNANQWVLISNYTNEQTGPESEATLLLQTSIFSETNNTVEVSSTVESFSGVTISSAYTLNAGNIGILLSESQMNLPPDQMQSTGSFTLLNIYPDGTTNQITLSESFISIEIIKKVDNELLLVGTLSRSVDESTIKTLALDENNNTLRSFESTVASSFTPTCIILNTDSYLLGGLNGDTRDFSWNNVYLQTNNTLAMYAFDYAGELTWNNNQVTEFSSLIVGGCAWENGYSWLLSKNSYDSFNNIAILKTDLFGNLK